jgi:hypothetical protein
MTKAQRRAVAEYAAAHGDYKAPTSSRILHHVDGAVSDTWVAADWRRYAAQYHKAILIWLTRRITAFEDFGDLIRAAGGYRPTLRPDQGWEYEALADWYDAVQESRGDPRRAYRG